MNPPATPLSRHYPPDVRRAIEETLRRQGTLPGQSHKAAMPAGIEDEMLFGHKMLSVLIGVVLGLTAAIRK